MAAWTVICEPVSNNANYKNKGGLVVLLTDGEHRHEVSRVSFTRRHSRNPEVAFDEQIQAEVAKAEEAAQIVNALLDDLERQQAEAVMAVRDRLHELLGKPLPAA